MIIDSHTHIGKFVQIIMPQEVLLEEMDKYGIDFSFVSNGSGVEVDHQQNPIPMEQQESQTSINEKLLKFVRDNKTRFGALLWMKPATEGCTPDFEKMIIENRDIVYGLKCHPYHSKLAFDSPQIEEYIKLAEKYDLVVVTHTACDYESSPELVYEMALKYPKVNFVMYHLGLGTDNLNAIEILGKLPNLYGDTSWVKPYKTMLTMQKCGPDKVLFGTDNPINGSDTLDDEEFYNFYRGEMKNMLSKEYYDKLMWKNAVRLFKLKQYVHLL